MRAYHAVAPHPIFRVGRRARTILEPSAWPVNQRSGDNHSPWSIDREDVTIGLDSARTPQDPSTSVCRLCAIQFSSVS
jgi:hypothetical protein